MILSQIKKRIQHYWDLSILGYGKLVQNKKVLAIKSFVLKHRVLCFVFATFLFTLFSNGYNYAVHDQAVYVPYLKKLLDPNLYKGDVFFNVQDNNTSFFWYIFFPLFKTIGIEKSFFIIFVLSLFLHQLAYYKFSYQIFKSHAISMIAVVGIMISKPSFAGIGSADTFTTPRYFALPFLIFAMTLFLKRKYIWAFILAGLVANVHMISAMFVLTMFGVYTVLNFKRIGLKKSAIAIVCGIVFMMPVFVWKSLYSSSGGVDFGVHRQWFNFLVDVLPFFYDFLRFDQFEYMKAGNFVGLCQIFIFFYGCYKLKDLISEDKRRMLKTFFSVILGYCVFAVFIAKVYPITIFVQLQIIRASQFLTILTVVFLAAFIWEFYKKYKLNIYWLLAMIFGLWGGALFGLFIPILITIRKQAVNAVLLMALIFGMGSSGGYLWRFEGLTHPQKISIYVQQNPTTDVQRWMRENTAKDAKFIIPINIGGYWDPDFRFGERPVLVTPCELGEVAFNVGYEKSVKERMNDLMKNKFGEFEQSGFYGKFYELAYWGYIENTAEDFRQLAVKYKVSYVITESSHKVDLPLKYSNERYNVYEID